MNKNRMRSHNLFAERGFTVLEVIVAINLSFLVLTFIVSFFLFTFRLTSSIQKKIEINNDVNNILFRLEEKLQRSDHFQLELAENGMMIIIDSRDSIFVTDSLINYSDIFFLNSFEEFNTEIVTDETTINHSVKKTSGEQTSYTKKESIDSEIVRSVRFTITAMNKNFSSAFFRNNYSAAVFRNIR